LTQTKKTENENENENENEVAQKSSVKNERKKKPHNKEEAESTTTTPNQENQEEIQQTNESKVESSDSTLSGKSTNKRTRKPQTNFRQELTDYSQDVDDLLIITGDKDTNNEVTTKTKTSAIDQELLDSVDNDNLHEILSSSKK